MEFLPEEEAPKKPWVIVSSQEEPAAPPKVTITKPKQARAIVPSQEESTFPPKVALTELSKEIEVIVLSSDEEASPPKVMPQSSPELLPSRKRNYQGLPPAANQRNYDSTTATNYNWGISTPDLLEALELKEGTIEYRNGIYEGQLQELRPHGKGIWRSADGALYDGDWVEGEYHGEGSYRNAKDNYYNGGWKQGRRDGMGVYLFRNGDWYQGEWKEGNMHGKGEACYADTGNIYRGQWQNNLRHGHGVSQIACNKASFKGHYITFEGEYRLNKRQGKFIITTPQGSQCELDFKDNKPIRGSSRLIKLSMKSGKSQLCLDKWMKR